MTRWLTVAKLAARPKLAELAMIPLKRVVLGYPLSKLLNFRHMKYLRFCFHAFVISIVVVSTAMCSKGMEEIPSSSRDVIYTLDPVTVTAEKRIDKGQHVPLSLTVISGNSLFLGSHDSIDEISFPVPNISIYTTNGRRGTFSFIRGVGSVDLTTSPSIGFYVDDVSYLNPILFNSPLYDIQRVELLRGPQGTLYGRNALAGVVNVHTAQPRPLSEGQLSISFGNFDLEHYELMANVPVAEERLILRINGIYVDHDGFTKNNFTGREAQDRHEIGGRVQLRWLPTDRLDLTIKIEGENFENGDVGVAPLSTTKFHRISTNFVGFEDSEALGTSFQLNYQGQWFRIKSITAWRRKDSLVDVEADFSPLDIAARTVDEDHRQITEELRFSFADDDSDWQWVAGFYYFVEDYAPEIMNAFGPDAVALGFVPFPLTLESNDQFDNDGYAFFGDVRRQITENVHISAGLRLDAEAKEVVSTLLRSSAEEITSRTASLADKESFTEWLPSASIGYTWKQDILSYFSWKKGYRSGGFNSVSTLEVADPSFNAEKTFNYEIGFKSTWLDRRVTLNIAAFYIDWEDQQILQFTSEQNPFIDNVGESRSIGLELEGRYLVAHDLEIYTNYGYVDAEFEDNRDPITGTDFTGNTVPFTPEQTFSVGVRYQRKLTKTVTGVVEADFQYIGQVYWDQANSVTQDNVKIVDLQLGLLNKRWEWLFWTKNVFDEEYFSLATTFPNLGAAGEFGAPLTYGTTLKWKF